MLRCNRITFSGAIWEEKDGDNGTSIMQNKLKICEKLETFVETHSLRERTIVKMRASSNQSA